MKNTSASSGPAMLRVLHCIPLAVLLCVCTGTLCAQSPEQTRHDLRKNATAIYALSLFPFDSPLPGSYNEQVMKQLICPDIKRGSTLSVIGYTDIVGMEKRNDVLSGQRARNVHDFIVAHVGPGTIARSQYLAAGQKLPVYDNKLPEGRFFNRTVEVIVKAP